MREQDIPGLDVAEHVAEGYRPLLESDGDWMVAIMNGTGESWSVPAIIEKHPKTDELFVLVGGRALMITAGRGERPGPIRQVEMRPNVLYMVRAGTWHITPMTPDARFIIVERTGTDAGGSVRVDLTARQRGAIAIPGGGGS